MISRWGVFESRGGGVCLRGVGMMIPPTGGEFCGERGIKIKAARHYWGGQSFRNGDFGAIKFHPCQPKRLYMGNVDTPFSPPPHLSKSPKTAMTTRSFDIYKDFFYFTNAK